MPAWRTLLLEKPGGDGAWGSSGSPPTKSVPWLLSWEGGSYRTGRAAVGMDAGAQRVQGWGGTYLVAQKWLAHLWGSVQYLSLNKILVVTAQP